MSRLVVESVRSLISSFPTMRGRLVLQALILAWLTLLSFAVVHAQIASVDDTT